MNQSSTRWPGLRQLFVVVLAGGLGLCGCGKKPEPATGDAGKSNPPSPSVSIGAGPTAVAAVREPGEGSQTAAPIKRDRLHQAFTDAVRAADNPPADVNRPPDETIMRKPSFKVIEDVAKLWDTIRFTTPDGKRILYTAQVETSVGNYQIALLPEQAPNHVRNFIALSKVGYYDGLFFERIRHEKAEGRELKSVEAGCPLGVGDPGNGSVGYWLKAELTPGKTMSHEEGVVGACRGLEDDTAACRFYTTLNKAPFLDGQFTIFGKVVQGLDVVRRIYQQGNSADDQTPGGIRPENPVIIRKVTIQQHTETGK